MNISVEDKAYLPLIIEGKPVPNLRQAAKLDEAIHNCLARVVQDLEREPEIYQARFDDFGATLAGSWGPTMTAIGARDLAVIKQGRKRAREYVEQISDQEIVQYFERTTIAYARQELLMAACGFQKAFAHYHYPAESALHNVLLENALEFGKAQPAYRFLEPLGNDDLPSPMPKGMDDFYEETWRHRPRGAGSRALRAAKDDFSRAYGKVMDTVRKSDGLFADRFNLLWDLVDAREDFETFSAKLTKPLEDYAVVWSRYSWHNHIEYKHKGAQAAWQAKLNAQRLEERLEETNQLILTANWSVSAQVKEARDALGVYRTILEDYEKKQRAENAKKQAKLDTQRKKLAKAMKLAEKPIMVSAVETDEGLWIDHRALIDGLKGRSSISKTSGVSYIQILDRIIETTKLRQWLILVLQDVNTGRRITKSKWSQAKWTMVSSRVATAEENVNRWSRKKHLVSKDSLCFAVQDGRIRIATTFYDLTKDVADAREYGRDPVINRVEFKMVGAKIPSKRGVWTPEDIKTYQPALAGA